MQLILIPLNILYFILISPIIIIVEIHDHFYRPVWTHDECCLIRSDIG